jgi:hypothetical protein
VATSAWTSCSASCEADVLSHRTLAEIAATIVPNLQRKIGVARARPGVRARDRQYGGPIFETASEFLRLGADRNIRALRPAGAAKGVVASAKLMSRLPRASIRLTDSPSGEALRAHLNERWHGIPKHRVAQGVLAVPESIQAYLRGRHKQAVRTNVRRAQELGMRCHRLTDIDERSRYADLLDPDMTDPWKRRQLLTRLDAECWIALDGRERPIGLAVFTVDAELAMLWSLVASESPARWLLHTEIVELLATCRVPYLMAAARMAPLLPPGIQYLQRLLGYRVTHILLS